MSDRPPERVPATGGRGERGAPGGDFSPGGPTSRARHQRSQVREGAPGEDFSPGGLTSRARSPVRPLGRVPVMPGRLPEIGRIPRRPPERVHVLRRPPERVPAIRGRGERGAPGGDFSPGGPTSRARHQRVREGAPGEDFSPRGPTSRARGPVPPSESFCTVRHVRNCIAVHHHAGSFSRSGRDELQVLHGSITGDNKVSSPQR